MHFLSSYGLFLVKLASIVIAILIVFAGLLGLASKGKSKQKGSLNIKSLNDKYKEYCDILLDELDDKAKRKELKKSAKAVAKKGEKNRLFVLNFHGDMRASSVNALREEITAILLIANPKDEILLRLESGGGMVNAYGLAASELDRIRRAKLKLTIAIDKVAASGGYMMACVASTVIAAPFAIIGSIGVIAQIPNFNKLLKDKHIDFEQITAGEYKRTLTMFGENTEKAREKMQQDINDIHELFKSFVTTHRPQINIEEVATGEYWFGEKAQQLKLVDALQTSDDYLMHQHENTNIFEVTYTTKKSFMQKLSSSASTAWHQLTTIRSNITG